MTNFTTLLLTIHDKLLPSLITIVSQQSHILLLHIVDVRPLKEIHAHVLQVDVRTL